jgi:cysteinyl-tRNA synthetase
MLRQDARANKRWDEADQLRNQVEASGFDIEDTPDGPRVRPKKQATGEG